MMTYGTVATVGSGYMGGGIAQVLAHSGATVSLVDISEEIAAKNYQRLIDEATRFVEEGIATAEDIDTIVRTTFGFRLPVFGPFAIADMAGVDVYSFCYASLQIRWPDRVATPTSLKALVDAGKFGTKPGAGYLDVPAGRTAQLDAYRNWVYAAFKELLGELAPAPLHPTPTSSTS